MYGIEAQWKFALSDEHWNFVEDLFESDVSRTKRGRRRSDFRAILNAVLWIEMTGASWKHLPSHYPPTQTCYKRYIAWRQDGTLQKVLERLGATPQ
ncbi:transposase [Paraburkholderia caribensis]|uniref:transposase n=1 Tax=Paraburkholderia caribensis TaxID=75105 RepID=UPI0009E737E3|nr:transposase [Paraburkholderia caribensis]